MKTNDGINGKAGRLFAPVHLLGRILAVGVGIIRDKLNGGNGAGRGEIPVAHGNNPAGQVAGVELASATAAKITTMKPADGGALGDSATEADSSEPSAVEWSAGSQGANGIGSSSSQCAKESDVGLGEHGSRPNDKTEPQPPTATVADGKDKQT